MSPQLVLRSLKKSWHFTNLSDAADRSRFTVREGMWSVAVLPDGRLVTGGSGAPGGGRLLIWDPAHLDNLPTLLGRDRGWHNSIGVLPDGRILTLGGGWRQNGRILLWDPDKTERLSGSDRADAVRAIAVLHDGRIFRVSDSGPRNYGGGTVSVWDPSRPLQPAVEVGTCGGAVGCIVLLPDGKVMTRKSSIGEVLTDAYSCGTRGALVKHQQSWVAMMMGSQRQCQ